MQTMREYLRVAFNRVPIGVRTQELGAASGARDDRRSRALASGSRFLRVSLRAVAERHSEPVARAAEAEGGCASCWRPRWSHADGGVRAKSCCSCLPTRASAGPPLGLLSLAGSLREAGYGRCIIDGALDRDYREHDCRAMHSIALCFGVSLLTGPMIRDAIEVSRLVRNASAECSDHLRRLASEPAKRTRPCGKISSTSSFAIRAKKRWSRFCSGSKPGNTLDLVQGCWFKRDGRFVRIPTGPPTPLSDLPAPAYDLIDFDAYERARAANASCPTPPASAARMPAITARTWFSTTAASTPYDADRVVDEVTDSGAAPPSDRSRAGGFEFSGGRTPRRRDRARDSSIPGCVSAGLFRRPRICCAA